MSPINLTRLGLQVIQRRFFVKRVRPFEERMRQTLNLHKNKRLVLARRMDARPDQYKPQEPPREPTIVTKERKLPSLEDSRLPYKKYSDEAIKSLQEFETFYDPLFNPHLPDERNRVDPNEEPFNAIYTDSQSESTKEYTSVRNITSPELWSHVENLARIKVPPMPKPRKANEQITPLPSGFVPPPETQPDLPYFISRTRNYLLPVYYRLHSDPNECVTIVKRIEGDLWQLEEDLRNHLESLLADKQRILTSVQETDGRIELRGKWIHQTVDWLYAQGF
uniref:Large ribosomal subunit protein mL49 n=1 Tax=Aceria tosichella TaxID=561515 RepID=A0A6G1S4D1_9ACAR